MQIKNTNQNDVKIGNAMSTLLQSAKSKFPIVLALTTILVTATFLRADSGDNHGERNQLAGTWVGHTGSTLAPALMSLTADGRVILSRPVTVQTGPNTYELASTGHGEWSRTGNDEFTSTVLVMRSGANVEFTGFVKQVLTIKLDRASDQLAVNSTVYIYNAAGDLLGALPQPGIGVFKRIIAGE